MFESNIAFLVLDDDVNKVNYVSGGSNLKSLSKTLIDIDENYGAFYWSNKLDVNIPKEEDIMIDFLLLGDLYV